MDAGLPGPALRGTVLAIASALAFGLSTPLVQRFSRGSGPFATACLLYAGAAAIGTATRSQREAQVGRPHLRRVAVTAAFGAAIAPALLTWGLARSRGPAASLMLNLEGPFTIALARTVYREHVGGRVAGAAAALLIGGVLLVAEHAGRGDGAAGVLGVAAVACAAFAWAVDNTLAKPLSALDPAGVVAAKALCGASLSLAVALLRDEPWPSSAAAAALLATGATGYGLSLRLYLRAQRLLGSGRTASVFASAPFWGALLAWALGEPFGRMALLGAGVMAVGIALHLTERHNHRHAHEPIEHEHAHRHDDGHHEHSHDRLPPGEHTHPHRHEPIVHEHPHVPDIHHEHGHQREQSKNGSRPRRR